MYRSFDLCQTPLAKAFQKGAGEATRLIPDKAPREPSDDCGERDSPRRLEVQARPKKKTTGPFVRCLGKLNLQQRTDEMPGTEEHWPWTFCLRLGNPHQLCYMNVTSLLHASQGMRLVELAGIEALCRQYAESGQLLVLSRQLVIRSRLPRWDFGPTQRDVSEFLLSFLSEGSTSWFRWEARQERRESARVVDTGLLTLEAQFFSWRYCAKHYELQRWHLRDGARQLRSGQSPELVAYSLFKLGGTSMAPRTPRG